jgi:hypothetical protein
MKTMDEYQAVKLSRQEARRLAALILFQSERLGERRLVAAPTPIDAARKLA